MHYLISFILGAAPPLIVVLLSLLSYPRCNFCSSPETPGVGEVLLGGLGGGVCNLFLVGIAEEELGLKEEDIDAFNAPLNSLTINLISMLIPLLILYRLNEGTPPTPGHITLVAIVAAGGVALARIVILVLARIVPILSILDSLFGIEDEFVKETKSYIDNVTREISQLLDERKYDEAQQRYQSFTVGSSFAMADLAMHKTEAQMQTNWSHRREAAYRECNRYKSKAVAHFKGLLN